VEGGACVPLTPEQRTEWKLENGGAKVSGNGPMLQHCQELSLQLVASLRDLQNLNPEEVEGLLDAAELRGKNGENGRRRNGNGNGNGHGHANGSGGGANG
jgi:hypothetical protein